MTALLHAAELVLLTPFVGGLLFAVVCLIAYVARTDDAEADRLPEDELLRREESWLDSPTARQDIAKTRTQRHEARMRAAGDRPWWEAS